MSFINKDFLNSVFSYDADSGVITWKKRPREHFRTKKGHSVFSSQFEGKRAGCLSVNKSYRHIRISFLDEKESILEHRAIFIMLYGDAPHSVDHINGDGTDNRLCNLRVADKMINGRNTKISTKNTSGVVGVCWSEQRKMWVAYINSERGKRMQLGRFALKEDAIAARLKAEKKFNYHENHGKR